MPSATGLDPGTRRSVQPAGVGSRGSGATGAGSAAAAAASGAATSIGGSSGLFVGKRHVRVQESGESPQ